MNATTFFSEEQFRSLKRDIQMRKRIDPAKTPYQKKVKVNGNTYTLRIHASFYVVGDCSYFCTCWYDYNYDGIYQSREIGGGSGPSVLNCNTYEDFCQILNDLLKRFPDFTQPQPTFEQMSLF